MLVLSEKKSLNFDEKSDDASVIVESEALKLNCILMLSEGQRCRLDQEEKEIVSEKVFTVSSCWNVSVRLEELHVFN